MFYILLVFLDGELVGFDKLAELMCNGMMLLSNGNYHSKLLSHVCVLFASLCTGTSKLSLNTSKANYCELS